MDYYSNKLSFLTGHVIFHFWFIEANSGKNLRVLISAFYSHIAESAASPFFMCAISCIIRYSYRVTPINAIINHIVEKLWGNVWATAAFYFFFGGLQLHLGDSFFKSCVFHLTTSSSFGFFIDLQVPGAKGAKCGISTLHDRLNLQLPLPHLS